ncbi:MAG: hypothetical protein OXU81_11125 [Gammaproteobacteria bacterium]|nr:hypothetical protein [Gammaproteobacteria bacterium]
MSGATGQPPKHDVLDAFAVEPDPGRETLERYLRTYPQYAPELVDLSRELARQFPADETPLSAEDQAKIDAAWLRHAAAAAAATADPFAALSVQDLRDVAKRLDVPRQVLTAFRNRRVQLSTVPRRFQARLAEATNSSLDQLVDALSSPRSSEFARSYKSDRKPTADDAVSFEQVLIDAGIPEERRAKLMSEAV